MRQAAAKKSVTKPEHTTPTKQNSPTSFSLKDAKDSRSYFDLIGDDLGVHQLADWYNIRSTAIQKKFPQLYLFFRETSQNLAQTLAIAYPEFSWDSLGFRFGPKRFTSTVVAHQRQIAELARQKLQIKTMEDWYQVTSRDLVNSGAGAVMHYYTYSPIRYLQVVYPEYQWKPLLFKNIPRNFRESDEYLTAFVQDLESKLGIKTPEQWNNINASQLPEEGRRLLQLYDGSPATTPATTTMSTTTSTTTTSTITAKLASHVYRKMHATSGHKNARERHFWTDEDNQRDFCEKFAEKYGITSLDQWYSVLVVDVKSAGGAGLLHRHNGSLYGLLSRVYPDFNWLPWKFTVVPKGFWENSGNIVQYFKWLENELNIKSPYDWYNVSYAQVRTLGGLTLLKKYHGLTPMLRKHYPNYEWTDENFKAQYASGKTQHFLLQVIQSLFPPRTSIINNYTHPQLRYPEKNRVLELDIFLPAYSLAFEYQGEQHFHNNEWFGPMDEQVLFDEYKKNKCKELGITLIYVPYWWNRSSESVAATIHQYRPDVIPAAPQGSSPIPDVAPTRRLKNSLCFASLSKFQRPHFMIGSDWHHSVDPSGWTMSPKLEGYRTMWDGSKGIFLLRFGGVVKPPVEISEKLPKDGLIDGILSFGKSQKVAKLLFADKKDRRILSGTKELWEDISFVISDIPSVNEIFSHRRTRLQSLVEQHGGAVMKCLDFVECDSFSHLLEYFRENPQGVLLRQPNAYYKHRKSQYLLNVQALWYDIGKVTHVSTGLMFVKLQNGVEFPIAIDGDHKVSKEDILVVRYSGIDKDNGSLQDVSFTKARSVTWQDVVDGKCPVERRMGGIPWTKVQELMTLQGVAPTVV